MDELGKIWGIIGDGEMYAHKAIAGTDIEDSVQGALLKFGQAKALALLDIAQSLRQLVAQNNADCDGDLRRRVQVLEQGEYRPGLDEERARA